MISRSAKIQLLLVVSISFLQLITVNLTASTTGAITGVVTDSATGKPIVMASVIVAGKTIGVKTDSTGSYTIRNLEPGNYSLKFLRFGYFSVGKDSITVMSDITVTTNMSLNRNPADTGKVITIQGKIDPKDKFGYAPKESTDSIPITTVDQLLTGVVDTIKNNKGQVFIRGGKASGVAYILDGSTAFPSNPGGGFGEQMEAGKALEASQHVTGTITGLITDSLTGEPIFGATILVVGTRLGAKTDSAGRYSIRDIPPGSYSLKISSVDHFVVEVGSISVISDSTLIMQRKLLKLSAVLTKVIDFGHHPPRMGAITGTILDSNSRKPLSDVSVMLAGAKLWTKTDTSGHFTIMKVPIGSYAVSIAGIGYIAIDIKPVLIALNEKTRIDTVLTKQLLDMSK